MSEQPQNMTAAIQEIVTKAIQDHVAPLINEVTQARHDVETLARQVSEQATNQAAGQDKLAEYVAAESAKTTEQVNAVQAKSDALSQQVAQITQATNAGFEKVNADLVTVVTGLHKDSENVSSQVSALSETVANMGSRNAEVEAKIVAIHTELEGVAAAGAEQAEQAKNTLSVVDQHLAGTKQVMDEVLNENRNLPGVLATAAKDQIAEVRSATDKYADERVKAETERDALETERTKWEKASTMITRMSDHEIERAMAEEAFKAREKELLRSIQAEREALESRYDLESHHIQRGINAYYPELSERLSELVEKDLAEVEKKDGPKKGKQ